jgi:hypothetical protein
MSGVLFRGFKVTLLLSVIHASVGSTLALADEYPAFEAPVNYAWKLNEADRARLYEGVKLLRYGDSIARAKELLGIPTREYTASDKKNRSFLFHAVVYYIARVDLTNVNTNDQAIFLSFDENGYLTQIGYSSMNPIIGEVFRGNDDPNLGPVFFDTRPPLPPAP